MLTITGNHLSQQSVSSSSAEEAGKELPEVVRVLDRRHVPASAEHVQTDIGQVVEQGQGSRPERGDPVLGAVHEQHGRANRGERLRRQGEVIDPPCSGCGEQRRECGRPRPHRSRTGLDGRIGHEGLVEKKATQHVPCPDRAGGGGPERVELGGQRRPGGAHRRYLYEAASIDRASEWFKFRTITLPLVWPLLLIAVLFRAIEAFRLFDLVYILTSGGPGVSTETLSFHVYKVAFLGFNTGTASAYGILMVLVVIVLTQLYLRYLNKLKED